MESLLKDLSPLSFMRSTPSNRIPVKESREILAVGLNPAFQSTLHLENFRPGQVNRASRKCNSIGGKGQNVAIACSQYGETDKVTVFQATGGMTGRYISSYLEELNIEHVTVPVSITTRTCTTLLDRKSGDMTELIEPAGRINGEERHLIETALTSLIGQSKRLEGIALCGTLPPGLTGSIYSLACQVKPENCVILLDAFQNAECLNTGKVNILKINSEEARKLLGKSDDADLLDIGKSILSNYQLPILAITDGPGIAFLLERLDNNNIKLTRYHIPALKDAISDIDLDSGSPSTYSSSLPEATGDMVLTRVTSVGNMAMFAKNELLLNPLGAGDTCSAVFLLEYLDTRNTILAFQHGLAAASASCLIMDNTSHFDMRVQRKIFEMITFESTTISLFE